MIKKWFHESWIDALGEDYLKLELSRVAKEIAILRKEDIIIPEAGSKNLLRAFKEVPLESIKVVLVGRNPNKWYNGLAIGEGERAFAPRAANSEQLKGLGRAIYNTYGEVPHSSLNGLQNQGVLLLNLAQSIGLKESDDLHLDLWSGLIANVFIELNKLDKVAWILPGTWCERYMGNITNEEHLIVKTHHLGSDNFSGKYLKDVNKYLKKNKLGEIQWGM